MIDKHEKTEIVDTHDSPKNPARRNLLKGAALTGAAALVGGGSVVATSAVKPGLAANPPGGMYPSQIVINSRMIYLGWTPADKAACAALVPSELTPSANSTCFMNQYVVDRPEQTSEFGAYSLTYAGVEVQGFNVNESTPGRWWTHYFNSSPAMREYTAAVGVPSSPGTTTLELRGDLLVATTRVDEKPVIRTTARAGLSAGIARGKLHYLTKNDGAIILGRYPYVTEYVADFKVLSLEFLDPSSSAYTLRPADPLDVKFGFYSPSSSFAYPGGQEPI
jgi:hypothetical protein